MSQLPSAYNRFCQLHSSAMNVEETWHSTVDTQIHFGVKPLHAGVMCIGGKSPGAEHENGLEALTGAADGGGCDHAQHCT